MLDGLLEEMLGDFGVKLRYCARISKVLDELSNLKKIKKKIKK